MDAAAAASAAARIEYRDRIAAFGAPAIVAMQRWVEKDAQSPGFAVAVIEAVGRSADASRAVIALRSLRAKLLDWKNVIDPAIARVEASRRSPRP